ncbi:MAG: hypothetical protein ACREVL_08270 [Solimonas sp.]
MLLAIATLGLLAACGGGGGGGGTTTPPQDVALDTPEEVARAVALSTPGLYLRYMAAATPRTGSILPKQAQRVVRKAAVTTDCEQGGSYTRDDPRTLDVDSPYSDELFTGADRHYHDCRRNFGSNDIVTSNGDIFTACQQSTTTDGSSCSYVQEDNGEAHLAMYRTRGSPGTPHVYTYTNADSGAFIKEVQTLTDIAHDYNAFDADGVSGRTRYLTRGYLHTLTRVRLANGSDASVEMISGEAEAPYDQEFVGEEDGAMRFTFTGIESVDGDGCQLGEFSVQTVQPILLTYVPETGEVTDVSGGTIDVGQGGKTGRLKLNADRSITVTDSRNHSTTYATPAAFAAALGDCAHFF